MENPNQAPKGTWKYIVGFFVFVALFFIIGIPIISNNEDPNYSVVEHYREKSSILGTKNIGSYDFTVHSKTEMINEAENERTILVDVSVKPHSWFYKRGSNMLMRNHVAYLYVDNELYYPENKLDEKYNNGVGVFFKEPHFNRNQRGFLVFVVPNEGEINGIAIESDDYELTNKYKNRELSNSERSSFGAIRWLFTFPTN